MTAKSRPTTDLPEAFLHRMSVLLGEGYPSFYTSLQHPALMGLRVNTLKLSLDTFYKQSPFKLSSVPWCQSGFIIDSDGDFTVGLTPGKHPYHRLGLYYLQEPSAMAAAEVLAPQPGEAVLDLAAAPGGKATHLAALMHNTGLLVANEVHPKRVWDLTENLERCGVTNAIVTNETPEKLSAHFGEYFDRVLLDAPCSGEGMFRKSQAARQEWKPEMIQSCAIRQSAILEDAARMVKPTGFLAYTTCTFSTDENESVIAAFLSHHPEFELVQIPPYDGFQPAVPEWIGFSSKHALSRAVRIWPHLADGEGHFIALLTKRGASKSIDEVHPTKYLLKQKNRSNSFIAEPTRDLLEEFCRDNLNFLFDVSNLKQEGSYLFQCPQASPGLEGLKVIRPGWWLGTINKRRFTPSHSLALGLKTSQVKRTLPLQIGDSHLATYLSGQSFPSPGEDGWILVTVDGYPLGWGKRVGNIMKNFYPHGLRQTF